MSVGFHRRRGVIVRINGSGEQMEAVRIRNAADGLKSVMARAGESPEVLLEATYGCTGPSTATSAPPWTTAPQSKPAPRAAT